MVALWNIAIGKINPDGTARTSSATAVVESGKGSKESADEPKQDVQTNVASDPVESELPRVEHQPQSDAKDNVDSKEYFEYEMEDDREVMVSKKTQYRVWRQFENGTHSKIRHNLIIRDTGANGLLFHRLQMILAYNHDIGKGSGHSLITSFRFRPNPMIDSAYAQRRQITVLFRLMRLLEIYSSFSSKHLVGNKKINENNSYHSITKGYKETTLTTTTIEPRCSK